LGSGIVGGMRVLVGSVLCFFAFVPLAQGNILLGVSDSGSADDYHTWSDTLQRRAPVLQTFHTWGTSLSRATERWRELDVLPILHISTNHMSSPPTPRQIALGQEDEYLLRLRQGLYEWQRSVVLRPLGEPNRPLNNYSAFLPDGSRRGPDYSKQQYIRAFRRIAIIARSADINADLRAMRLPLVTAAYGPPGQVRIAWSPLPGREKILGNGPHQYWPGQRWVDIVGTSFFSAWPYWRELRRMQRRWQRWPFWLLEWGLRSGRPRFVRNVYRWCQRRCQGMVFYQGFGDEVYRIERYPLALSYMRNLSRDTRLYPLFASQ
jgi:hypothetical protein